MNVCALDVVARTPDFESLAMPLELRGWEWDLLHAFDGQKTLGASARELGIDNESAVNFVHEAIHRGLVGVATMSLEAYRMRSPHDVIVSPPQKPILPSAPVATPVLETSEPPKSGAISFSVNAFDWNEPETSFEEPVDDEPPAKPGKTVTARVGGVHYDDRFGVEHPDGPFSASHDAVAHPADVARDETPVTPEEPAGTIAAAAAAVAGATAAAFGAVVGAVTPAEKPVASEAHGADTSVADVPLAQVHAPIVESHESVTAEPQAFAGEDESHSHALVVEDPAPLAVEPPPASIEPAAASVVHDPFAPAHVDDPFAMRTEALEDPFAPAAPVAQEAAPVHASVVEDPFAAPAHDRPFAASAMLDAHEPVEDPFAATSEPEPFAGFPSTSAAHGVEPFPEPAHEAAYEPQTFAASHGVEHEAAQPTASSSSTPIAMSFGDEPAFERVDDEPAGRYAEASSNGHAVVEEPADESSQGSISFSFSGGDTFESHAPNDDAVSEQVSYATPSAPPAPAPAASVPAAAAKPTYENDMPSVARAIPAVAAVEPTTIEHLEDEKLKPAGDTQSTFFEREAIDTDAARDFDEKAKSWKESLSWREQQELNDAMETGKEKQGAITSFLRMLGVR